MPQAEATLTHDRLDPFRLADLNVSCSPFFSQYSEIRRPWLMGTSNQDPEATPCGRGSLVHGGGSWG